MKAYTKEVAVAVTILALMIVLAFIAPGYFTRENLTDLFLANTPVMIIALGMTLIILLGQIDISVGSVFAICSIVAGVSVRSGFPIVISGLIACAAGAACGALNGALVAYLRVPSIVVTLATMVALRDGLRWQTQGSWIGNLPRHFQWLGTDAVELHSSHICTSYPTHLVGHCGTASSSDWQSSIRNRIQRGCCTYCRNQYRASYFLCIHLRRVAHRFGCNAQFCSIQSDPQQPGTRPGDESDRGCSRRWDIHHGGSGTILRNRSRSNPARFDRYCTYIFRYERLLGKGDPGRNYSGCRGYERTR